MTIRKTLDAGWILLKKVLVAVGNGSDAIWSQPANATQPALQKGVADQNIDSIWGTPADIEPTRNPPATPAATTPVMVAPLSTETPLGVTPQKKNVRGRSHKEPTLEEILPVPDDWK